MLLARISDLAFRDAEELITAIDQQYVDQYVDRHNQGPKPFI